MPGPAASPLTFPADDLLTGILATALNALVLLTPVAGPVCRIVDFRFPLPSDAARSMLRLPARPTHLPL